MIASPFAVKPPTSAATPSSTAWRAQSADLFGSALSLQVISFSSWPPRPPELLICTTAPWATSRTALALSVSVSYVEIVITVTGSPVKVTSGSWVGLPELSLSLSSSPPPPQAARPSRRTTALAAASPRVRVRTVIDSLSPSSVFPRTARAAGAAL